MYNIMRHFRIILFSLLLGLLLLSASCGRKCIPDPIVTVMIPQEILDYVDFKAGSYWLFEDSVSGQIDSSVVVSSKHIMEDVGSMNSCGKYAITRRYENIQILMERYDPSGNLRSAWSVEFNNGPKKQDHSLDNIYIIDNNNSFTIGYPFDKIYQSWGPSTITEFKIDSINIKGTIFKGILNTHIIPDGLDAFTDILYAKKIGSIQREFTNHGTRIGKTQLIRYRIL
jgi:hypothetical protein